MTRAVPEILLVWVAAGTTVVQHQLQDIVETRYLNVALVLGQLGLRSFNKELEHIPAPKQEKELDGPVERWHVCGKMGVV